MKAIVLCGGLGTRLGDLTRATPKPLIPVAERPFLTYVLDHLVTVPLDEIILAVSFEWQKVQKLIGHQWRGTKVSYSIESTPQGTGGAILQALLYADCAGALVANGDTLLKIDLADFLRFTERHTPDIAIALKMVDDTGRFGSVDIDAAGRVLAFREKTASRRGFINSGVYWVSRSAFAGIALRTFSFEQDILSQRHAALTIVGQPTDAYFIDMGIPEDLARAQHELSDETSGLAETQRNST